MSDADRSDPAGRGGRSRTIILAGSAASEGVAMGTACRVAWGVPEVPPAAAVAGEARDREMQRFGAAREWARCRLDELKGETESRLGRVEARIFDPQILMLDDPEVVAGTEAYIVENGLSAARAFDLRMLELKERWSRTSHPMVLDRLNDLEDLKLRVLSRLLDLPNPWDMETGSGVVAVARNLTPSFVARLNAADVVGIATDEGSRTSHWAILARSLEIPAAVGLGDVSEKAADGQLIIVDGGTGRIVIDPDTEEQERLERRRSRLRDWRQVALREEAGSAIPDRQGITLRANLDLPAEAVRARNHGAQGVGLFRTEFLVVGRNAMPGEEEQYRAYRAVARAFPSHAVLIRTFDLGGDKFPMFLRASFEENPLLGRRGVRVCHDEPELFLTQLRAILRAAVHGDIRIMVPMVNGTDEISVVRELLGAARADLQRQGVPMGDGIKLGAMIETPAAALNAAALAPYVDFLSIGTNDLVQYALAVDRTNARLAHLYDPLHPAVLRLIKMVVAAGRDAGIEVSACGEMAGRPGGAFVLVGLGVEALSVAWPSLPEIRNLLRTHSLADIRAAAARALDAPTSDAAKRALSESLQGTAGRRLFPLGP